MFACENDSHATEIRIRIIHELALNEEYYLKEDNLSTVMFVNLFRTTICCDEFNINIDETLPLSSTVQVIKMTQVRLWCLSLVLPTVTGVTTI